MQEPSIPAPLTAGRRRPPIYLAHGCRHQGLGKRLYHALEECLKMQGVLNLNACVAVCRSRRMNT